MTAIGLLLRQHIPEYVSPVSVVVAKDTPRRQLFSIGTRVDLSGLWIRKGAARFLSSNESQQNIAAGSLSRAVARAC
jgi:hypothetical protein